VKLEFKTVSELVSLLQETDFQVYKQAAKIHRELRKELNSIPVVEIRSENDFLSTDNFSPFPPPTTSTSSKVSLPIISTENSSFSSFSSSNVSNNLLKIVDNLCADDNCSMLIITSLIVSVIFIIGIFGMIILCKRKHNYSIKTQQGIREDVQSSYIKSSISLDDIPNVTSPTPLPQNLPSSPTSPVSVLQNSPFYSPVRSSPSHGASFTTFHPPCDPCIPVSSFPHLDQVRTSPEGSSCSDHDNEHEENTDGDSGQILSINSSSKAINNSDNPDKEEIYAKVNKSKQCKNNNCDPKVDRNSSSPTSIATKSNLSECLI